MLKLYPGKENNRTSFILMKYFNNVKRNKSTLVFIEVLKMNFVIVLKAESHDAAFKEK